MTFKKLKSSDKVAIARRKGDISVVGKMTLSPKAKDEISLCDFCKKPISKKVEQHWKITTFNDGSIDHLKRELMCYGCYHRIAREE